MSIDDPILVDVDGTVANFTDAILSQVGYEGPPLTVWNFTEVLDPEQQILAEKLLKTYSFWASLDPIPGALPGISYIKSLGFEVHWVTSPWISCPTWETARRYWLQKHFGATHSEITITSRKDLVRGLAIIDDKPAHIQAWLNRNPGSVAVLYDQPYNQGFLRGVQYARRDWSELPELIRMLSIAVNYSKP